MGRPAAVGTAEEKLERRRERCKLNQRRYRANMRVSNRQRRADMDELDRVKQRLETHVAVIERTGLWCHAEEQSVVEYFRLFEFGYTGSHRQDSFLRFFADPNVWCNGHRGVDAITQVWKGYNSTFTSLCMKRVQVTYSSRAEDGAIVEINCVAELGTSMSTIQALFPQILSRQDLVDKMLRSPFVLPLHASFVFDEHKQMIWTVPTAKVVQGLLNLFGNLDDVAVAASNSAIQPDAMIRSGRDNVTRHYG